MTGPTGSGKSTTLYACLQEMDFKKTNIITVEDPVEYQFDIINQTQVKEDIGLSFARVSSQPGRGSTFTVTLPAGEPAAADGNDRTG